MAAVPHPNTIFGGLIGGGAIGQGVLWILTEEGIHPSSRWSGIITAATASVVLFCAGGIKYTASHGLVGTWNRIKNGGGGLAP